MVVQGGGGGGGGDGEMSGAMVAVAVRGMQLNKEVSNEMWGVMARLGRVGRSPA